VTKLKDKPFALVGVNTNNPDPKKLKAVMTKEKLNWRSVAARDSIKEKWGFGGTPAYYIIDPKGVIRYKWVGSPGEKAIDKGLAKLIREAERGAKKE
jgi:peroxiredoxin